MVSQNQLYSPISVNLGFLNVALSRNVGSPGAAGSAGSNAAVRPKVVAGTSSTPDVNVHPPTGSESRTTSEPNLPTLHSEGEGFSPVAEHPPEAENSGYSIQLEIKTCVHGTLDAATPTRYPVSLIIFEVDFGVFAQRASVEFRFRGRQSTVMHAIPSIPGVPSLATGISVLDHAPHNMGEESQFSRVFSFPGGVKWDFKRRNVPRKCQFAFLLSRSDSAAFYLSFRPSIESSLKDANAAALQLTGQPKTITFDPSTPPHGAHESVAVASLGKLKGRLQPLLGPSQLRPEGLFESPRQSSEAVRPETDGTVPPGVDTTGYVPLEKLAADTVTESLHFEDPPTFKQASNRVEYICECGPLKSRWGQESTGCARSSRAWSHESFRIPGAAIGIQGATGGERYQGFYIVLGLFNKDSAVPREVVVQVEDEDSMRRKLRKGVRSLRGVRSFISLKTVSGFALYKCNPKTGGHKQLKVDSRTENILQQLFLTFHAPASPRGDEMDAWREWIRKNINGGNDDPLAGIYSLQLLLKWSVFRISLLTLTPCALSLAIGIWYQAVTGDVQTAWTVSSYIVTTGGVIIALLAIATASGQV